MSLGVWRSWLNYLISQIVIGFSHIRNQYDAALMKSLSYTKWLDMDAEGEEEANVDVDDSMGELLLG
jgi:hypothetical protein